MSNRRLAIVWTLAIVAFGWGAALLLIRDYRKPNVEVFTEMAYSLAAETQLAYPGVLPGGRVEQAPPEGTVYRGALAQSPYVAGENGIAAFPYRRFADPADRDAAVREAERAGTELVNPLTLNDPVVLAAGKELFRMNCSACHGADGLGQTPVSAHPAVPEKSLLGGEIKARADGYLYYVITWGLGAMPPHAAHVAPADRWRVIAHLRALQGLTPPLR